MDSGPPKIRLTLKPKVKDPSDEESLHDDDYKPKKKKKLTTQGTHTKKKRKTTKQDSVVESTASPVPSYSAADALLDELIELALSGEEDNFENIIRDQLSEFLQRRKDHFSHLAQVDATGTKIRPLTNFEIHSLLKSLVEDVVHESPLKNIVARKLKLQIHREKYQITTPTIGGPMSEVAEPMRIPPPIVTNVAVLNALESIKYTPFHRSFQARLFGPLVDETPTYIARDWESRSPWMELMDDVRLHYSFMHPEREQEENLPASIDYCWLKREHLPQIHDLLHRIFWPGIDVSDSLDYSPERCTVVACYKRLVVGAIFLSSPRETYVTYLFVRKGWEGCQIASNMLYHLLQRSPKRDIILHVSADNPAMLLYNRFGFKAEEFIIGFYENYVGRQSRASKNAFRLRLRR